MAVVSVFGFVTRNIDAWRYYYGIACKDSANISLKALWRLDPTTSMEFRMEGNVLNKKFQSHNTTSSVKSSLDKNILKSSLGEVYEHVKFYMDFISSVN
jgi:hypothetical protein